MVLPPLCARGNAVTRSGAASSTPSTVQGLLNIEFGEWLESARGTLWDSMVEARAPVVAFAAMVLALLPSGGLATLAFLAWTTFMLAAPAATVLNTQTDQQPSGGGLPPLLRLSWQRFLHSVSRGAAGGAYGAGSRKQQEADGDDDEELYDPMDDGFDAARRRAQKYLKQHGLPLGLTAMTTFMRVPRACRMALAFAAWASFEVMY